MSSLNKILKQVQEVYPRAKIMEMETAMDNTIEWIQVSKKIEVGRDNGRVYLTLGECGHTLYNLTMPQILGIIRILKNDKIKEIEYV